MSRLGPTHIHNYIQLTKPTKCSFLDFDFDDYLQLAKEKNFTLRLVDCKEKAYLSLQCCYEDKDDEYGFNIPMPLCKGHLLDRLLDETTPRFGSRFI